MTWQRKPPKFTVGETRGAFVILDAGRPEVLAKDRVVRVRCTRCKAIDIVSENWLARRESLATVSCYECRDTRSPTSWKRGQCGRGKV